MTLSRESTAFHKIGYEVTSGAGKTGVVELLHNGDGPTVMLRADTVT
jgi:hippurate hydrolase